MNARAQFKVARHLYRHGMRIAPVTIPGDIDSNFRPEKYSRSIRPECEQALAMAARLHPYAPQCLPRVPAAPFVSTLRTLYRHNNPRMYADNGYGSRSVGYPYRRQALKELRTALHLARFPILPGPTAPLASLSRAERHIACRRAVVDRLNFLAARDAAVATAIFGRKAA